MTDDGKVISQTICAAACFAFVLAGGDLSVSAAAANHFNDDEAMTSPSTSWSMGADGSFQTSPITVDESEVPAPRSVQGVVQDGEHHAGAFSGKDQGKERKKAADDASTVPEALQPGPPPPLTDGQYEYVSVQVENDVFTGTDRHYTNGLRASWLSAEGDVPHWLMEGARQIPFFPMSGVKRWGMSLGHSLFTPSDTQRVQPTGRDRPYSGWLYGGVGLVSDTGTQLDSMELLIGVVGPSAHGETVQNQWHRLIGAETAKGWDNWRLHDEPGFMLTYERKWRAWQTYTLGGLGMDVTPHVGATLGNVMTYAAAGGTIRLGFDLPQDYGPPRIRPSLPGTTFFVPSGPMGWYVFVGIEGRAVARNIFLDGNTFRDSPSVDKLPFVGDAQAGLATTVGDWRIAYTQVWRTREFRTQGEPDTFGSLSATVRF